MRHVPALVVLALLVTPSSAQTNVKSARLASMSLGTAALADPVSSAGAEQFTQN